MIVVQYIPFSGLKCGHGYNSMGMLTFHGDVDEEIHAWVQERFRGSRLIAMKMEPTKSRFEVQIDTAQVIDGELVSGDNRVLSDEQQNLELHKRMTLEVIQQEVARKPQRLTLNSTATQLDERIE